MYIIIIIVVTNVCECIYNCRVTCVHINVFILQCMYASMSTTIYLYIYVCIYLSIYICMYVSM